MTLNYNYGSVINMTAQVRRTRGNPGIWEKINTVAKREINGGDFGHNCTGHSTDLMGELLHSSCTEA